MIPRPAATVMLLRDGDGLEVLLLRRSAQTPFVPGVHVFPGGAVDAADRRAEPAVRGHARADRMLGVQSEATSFWIAAARECFEEAGVLLAESDDGPVGPGHPALETSEVTRRRIHDGELHFGDHLRHHGLVVPVDRIAYVSRWITPDISPRRYDTRFFAAAMPEGQEVEADGWEAVESSWWSPSAALRAAEDGEIALITPTVSSLTLLSAFDSTATAIATLQDGALHDHRVVEVEGGERVPLPHERRPSDVAS